MLRIISDYSLWKLIEDAKRYRMILYADAAYRKPVKRLLQYVDIEIDYCVADEPDDEARSVYDLLYENTDDIMVVVAGENFAESRIVLEGLGLRFVIDFKDIQRYSSEVNLVPYNYDPILGYNLGKSEYGIEGFRIFGDIHNARLRVLTLGGSTTDPYIYPFKSWSECLHEVLNSKGCSNVVICGGVAGYRSSEELFKLIRDGFAFKPDIVLNYSGFNDLYLDEHPYINSYMRQISLSLKTQKTQKTLHFNRHEFDICWGQNGDFDGTVEETYAFWINNEKMIHAICEARQVRQITFLQPSLFNGWKIMSEYEQSYQLNLVYIGQERFLATTFGERLRQFTLIAQNDIGKYEWVKDLSDIMGDKDVYIDHCHVNEFGNQIIAENIANVVLGV